MILFALTPETSDALTVWGFVVGVFGCTVGVFGFAYTIYQVRKVKAAAEAAAEAATKTLAESKGAYERFVAAFGSRLLSELENAINTKDWKLAVVRSQDLAELLATLPSALADPAAAALIAQMTNLRDLTEEFVRLVDAKAEKIPPRVAKKWSPLRLLLHSRLDQLRKPFRNGKHGDAK